MEFVFFVAKANNLDKKLSLLQLLTECCPNWANRTQKNTATKLCQEKIGKSFNTFASHTHTQKNVCWIFESCRLKNDAQRLQMNL